MSFRSFFSLYSQGKTDKPLQYMTKYEDVINKGCF